MKIYERVFKEEVETYKAKHPILQEFIVKHNICDVYMTRNEGRIKLNDTKYLKNFLKLVNDFNKYVVKNIDKLFNDLDVPLIKRKNIMRRVDNAQYAIEDANKKDEGFPTEAVVGYSTLHEAIKLLKDFDN